MWGGRARSLSIRRCIAAASTFASDFDRPRSCHRLCAIALSFCAFAAASDFAAASAFTVSSAIAALAFAAASAFAAAFDFADTGLMWGGS